MATSKRQVIDHPGEKVIPPQIRARARLISRGGSVGDIETHSLEQIFKERSDGSFRETTNPLVFLRDVTIQMQPDQRFLAHDYSVVRDYQSDVVGSRGAFVGELASSYYSGGYRNNRKSANPVFGVYSDTYYTVNGKDPVRTKASLYTGPFVLVANQFLSGNVIIKAKTYYAGRESDVMIVEFNIAKDPYQSGLFYGKYKTDADLFASDHKENLS